MSNIRFSLLLKTAMDDFGVGPNKLEEILRQRNVFNITNKRISEYIRAVSTPSLEKAKIIMEALEFPIDEESLRASLELNRALIKEEKEEQLLIGTSGYGRTMNVHIRLRNLIPGQSTLDTEQRVISRVRELYGTQDIVKYVEKLIATDLQQSILKGEQNG